MGGARHGVLERAMKRGDIVLCVISGDFGKVMPAVVVQSDLFQGHTSVTVCPLTTTCTSAPMVRVPVAPDEENNLRQPSQIMIDKISSIRSERVRQVIGKLGDALGRRLDEALKRWLGLM